MTRSPVDLKTLKQKLHELDCHPVDIADALTDADLEWRFRQADEG